MILFIADEDGWGRWQMCYHCQSGDLKMQPKRSNTDINQPWAWIAHGMTIGMNRPWAWLCELDRSIRPWYGCPYMLKFTACMVYGLNHIFSWRWEHWDPWWSAQPWPCATSEMWCAHASRDESPVGCVRTVLQCPEVTHILNQLHGAQGSHPSIPWRWVGRLTVVFIWM